MSRASQIANLIQVKQNLADKYDRLAKACNSVTGRTKLHRKAEGIRRQVATLKLLAQ